MLRPLGDVHLGKVFKNGVPLHRRGERERMQWAEFEAHLNAVDPGDLHVQVGDLFDQAIVPYSVVLCAARLYKQAAEQHPTVTYGLFQGNHDDSRDVEKVTAFDLFCEIVADVPNIIVAREAPELIVHSGMTFVMIPWHPVMTAAEVVVAHAEMISGADVVLGHWDIIMGHGNQLPSELLAKLGVKQAITGHDHLKRDLALDGLPIHVTGSMQPYSHSEDPDGRLYVTHPLAEVLANIEGYGDKNLRVLLAAGEVLDVPVDCLSLTFKREGVDEDDQAPVDVEFEAFDMQALFAEAASILPEALRQQVWDKIQDARIHDDAS